jgi:hypothetical protein
VSEAWVVNASPLILFSRIDRLDLIERLAPGILVPNAVIERPIDVALRRLHLVRNRIDTNYAQA